MFWHPDVPWHDTGEGVFEAAPSPLLAAAETHPESAGRILNMRAATLRPGTPAYALVRPPGHPGGETLPTVEPTLAAAIDALKPYWTALAA